jgi:hypothetical protein
MDAKDSVSGQALAPVKLAQILFIQNAPDRCGELPPDQGFHGKGFESLSPVPFLLR